MSREAGVSRLPWDRLGGFYCDIAQLARDRMSLLPLVPDLHDDPVRYERIRYPIWAAAVRQAAITVFTLILIRAKLRATCDDHDERSLTEI